MISKKKKVFTSRFNSFFDNIHFTIVPSLEIDKNDMSPSTLQRTSQTGSLWYSLGDEMQI